jgi:phospholipid-binding lipoprotein MlaA
LRLRLIIAVAGLGASLLAGEAAAAPAAGQSPPREDPFEAQNRRAYAVQDRLDRAIFNPLAKLYGRVTPGPLGKALHNLVSNLSEPILIANDILQARLKDAGRETLRLTANSTAGLLGLMDVAAGAGLKRKNTDFGITLGVWGVKAGPYVYLPLLGPSTARDLLGMGGDVLLNPLTWTRFPGHQTLQISSAAVGGLDTRLRADPSLKAILRDAADPYATLRSVYLQDREAAIRGGPATPVLAPLDDEPAATPETPPQSQPSESQPPESRPPESQPPPDQAAPPSDQAPPVLTPQPAPGSSADAGSAARFAAADDGPIATARACDLDGVATAPAHGA